MANLQFSKPNVNRVPINRNNLFYSDQTLNFHVGIGKDYLERVTNMTVILYEVDLNKTNLDATYNEAKEKEVVYKTPVELHVLYNIQKGELMSYDKSKNMGTYIKGGKLTFGVYQATLDELEADIKVGDYIGVQVTPTHMEFYTVVNDGRNNFDNPHSNYGLMPTWRSIECSVVTSENEFKG